MKSNNIFISVKPKHSAQYSNPEGLAFFGGGFHWSIGFHTSNPPRRVWKCQTLRIRILCGGFGFNTNENIIGFHALRCTTQHISCFALIKRESKKQKNFSILYKITFIFILAWKSFQPKGSSLNILFVLHKQRCGRISQFLQDHLHVRLQIFLWDNSYVLK